MIFKRIKNFIILIIILIIFLILKSNYNKSNNNNNNYPLEEEQKEEEKEIKLNNLNDEKYIMYSCHLNDTNECGGWGDRVKGIMSAYWWSILSGRKLILNINRPCELSQILEPNKINWNIKLNKTNISNYSEVTLFKFNDDHFKNELRYIDLKKFHSDKNLIILKTNRNFVWSFANTKVASHIQMIFKLGYNNTNQIDMPFTYRKVNSKLFKLTPKLDSYLKNFYSTKLKPKRNTKLICVQIRTRNARYNPKMKDELYLSPKVVNKFWIFVKTKLIKKVKLTENYKIFVAADNVTFRNDAIRIFGPDRIAYNNGDDIINIDYIKTKNNNNDECPAGIVQTFKDFYSFQYCDMAIITQYSQFGRFGIWNKGKVPSIYYSYDGKKFTRIINFSQQIDYTF
jgi:hypothetical protein